MASLPPIRKLYLEDYPSQKSWIGGFLTTLNQFMTSVVSALTGELTLVDNTTSDVKTITFFSVPTSSNPVSVAWNKKIDPSAVIVGNVKLKSGTFSLSTAIGIQWQMSSDNKSLQIIDLVGITPSSTAQYTLTLVCIAG